MNNIATYLPITPIASPRSNESSPRTAVPKRVLTPGDESLASLSHQPVNERFEKTTKSLTADLLQLSLVKDLSVRAFSPKASPEQLLEKLAAQQRIITAEAIEEDLIKKFPIQADRDLALNTLTQMTRFANMKGMNALQSALVRYRNQTSQAIYYQGEATLGSTLGYLFLKHKTSQIMNPFVNPVTTEVGDLKLVESGAILLDQPTKARLKRDPKLCEHIRQQGIKLLYPQGWDEGVTPFHQPPLDAMMEKLVPVMATVKQRQAHSPINEVEAIQQALSAPTRALMQSLNLENSLVLVEPLFGLIPFFKRNNTSPVEKVAEQLAPNQLSLNELEKALAESPRQADPEKKQLILKILNDQAEVYSPLRLTQLIQAKHQDILARAKKLDIPPQSIFYYIDEKKKSYGLINYQYAQANPVNPEQFIERLDALPDSPDKKLLVILDDVASSGDSLVDVYNKIREQLGQKAQLHFAPLVSTNQANSVFHEIQDSDPNCTYSPSQTVTLFKDQPFYKQASPALKTKLERAVIHLGHRDNGLSLAFPYMAPDNNNGFFAKHMAPLFTLNGAGCKNIEPQAPAKKAALLAPKASSSPVVPKLDLARLQSALQALKDQ